MSFWDRINPFRSGADRRLEDEARAAWGSVPGPSEALALRARADAFGSEQKPAKTPTIEWNQDQSRPPPRTFTYQAGYSDHLYKHLSAPLGFEGFGLERIRVAVATHRLGNFWETSALMVAILGYAPVLAALKQRVAPLLGLERHIRGGDKGLAKLVAAEVEAALIPRGSLLPSPYFTPQTWGTMGVLVALMNFCVLQHVDGEPDEETGVRQRWTRIWPPWALQWSRSPRKLLANTTEGPVEVRNDGHFTLVAAEEEPYLSSPILALGEEAFAGKLTREQQLSWQDFFGKPKLWATPPEMVATHGKGGGDAFASSIMDILYGPDGRAVLPHGSDVKAVSITGEGSQAFESGALRALVNIFMVLTGSAGTIGNAASGSAGTVYQPAKNGAWNVRHDLIASDTSTCVGGVNQGHVAPYCDINYGDAIERAKRAGTWVYPVLSIPIPAPDRDERIDSEVKRYKAFTEQVVAERAAGGVVDPDRMKVLGEKFEVVPFTLADTTPKGGEIYAYHIENKIVAPDQVLDRLGLPPLPHGAGSPERLAEERLAGGDKPGALANSDAAEPPPVASSPA